MVHMRPLNCMGALCTVFPTTGAGFWDVQTYCERNADTHDCSTPNQALPIELYGLGTFDRRPALPFLLEEALAESVSHLSPGCS